MAVRIEDLLTGPEREHELHARFGRAAMQAQAFEHQFATIVAFRDALVAPNSDSEPPLETLIDHWQSRTAGQVLHSLRKAYGKVPEEVIDLWDRAVTERNRLMHRFYLEHSRIGNTSSPQGIQRMVDDADELHDLFALAAEWCADIRGTTVANIQQLVEDDD